MIYGNCYLFLTSVFLIMTNIFYFRLISPVNIKNKIVFFIKLELFTYVDVGKNLTLLAYHNIKNILQNAQFCKMYCILSGL